MNRMQVVLVRAENPINIGQAARAMKNFGVRDLVLVDSADHQVEQAYTPGWKARAILDKARVVQSLDEVIDSSVLAVAFTARPGKRRGEPRSFSEIARDILEVSRKQRVALVFGNEKNGLSNAELKKCHWLATIPVEAEYSSLNLSHAVAVVLFTLFSLANRSRQLFKKPERFYTKPHEFDALMDDFHQALVRLGYKNTPKNNLLERVSGALRHYFQKTGVERRELHLFKAFLSRVKQRLD